MMWNTVIEFQNTDLEIECGGVLYLRGSNDELAPSSGNYEPTDCTFNIWSNGSYNSVILVQW